MKRIIVYLVVIFLTVTVLLFLYNPDLLEKAWLWIVGLIGSIVALIQQSWAWIKRKFKPVEDKTGEKPNNKKTEHNELHVLPKYLTAGTSTENNQKITLLRSTLTH